MSDRQTKTIDQPPSTYVWAFAGATAWLLAVVARLLLFRRDEQLQLPVVASVGASALAKRQESIAAAAGAFLLLL